MLLQRKACSVGGGGRRGVRGQEAGLRTFQPLQNRYPCRSGSPTTDAPTSGTVSNREPPQQPTQPTQRSSTPPTLPKGLHVPYGMDLASYPSMEGKNVLLTGGARGLGLCTGRLLAHLGAHVYLADVDAPALTAAVETLTRDLKLDTPDAAVMAVTRGRVTACPRLDLGRQESVHAFADWWLAKGEPLHVLVNNAGANFMGVEPWFTDQGVAGLPQVNYLGPYTLTRRLSSCLEATATQGGQATGSGAKASAEEQARGGDGFGLHRTRIVNVCSVMHRFSSLPEDPQFFLRDWWIGGSYRNCKLALTMTTELLQQRLGPRGVDSVSVDPGAVFSGIWSTSRVFGRPPGSTLLSAIFSTPEDACATMVHAAAAPASAVTAGGYYARGIFAKPVVTESTVEPLAGAFTCVDWPIRRLSGGAWASQIEAVDVAPHAKVLAPAEALWDACADLAGLPRQV